MSITSAGTRISPPQFMSDMVAWERLVVNWMRAAHQGHIANASTFSCASGTVSTVLTDSRIGAATFIGFSPTTANGAAESPWVSSQSKGAATITHANAATGDRTFTICFLG